MARIKNVAHKLSDGNSPFKKSVTEILQDSDTVSKRRKYTRRHKPGTLVLREIRRLQKTTNLLIPFVPFRRVIREITQNLVVDMRFQVSAVVALQTAAEAYLTDILESANLCTTHAGRTTLMCKDLDLATKIRGGPCRPLSL